MDAGPLLMLLLGPYVQIAVNIGRERRNPDRTECDTVEMSATVPKSVVLGENMEGSDILSPLCLF